MVGLRWSGHYNGSDVVFGGTTTVAGGGLDTTMVGLQWRG